MLKFEKYLQEFTNTVSITEFLINLIVTAILALFIKWFYIRFGSPLSNRRRFADNFLLLSLTTMLIITIVKSSIALSLGLVGALSIVRFRSAIKNPEELTYLFLAIAIGLASGANQPVIAIIACAFILMIIYLNNRIKGKRLLDKDDRMFLNIKTSVQDIELITNHVAQHLTYVEFKRMDKAGENMHLTYLFKSNSIKDIENLKNDLLGLSKDTTLSVVGEPSLLQ